MPARQLAGFAVQIGGQVQRFRRSIDAAVLFVHGDARHAHRKGDVLAHGHMRIQRVGLEHHCQTAFGGGHMGGVLLVDADLPARGIFEPCNQAQQGGFAAARGADEDGEFAVFDGQVQRRDDFDVTEALGNLV